MSNIDQDAKKKMHKALQKYKEDKSSAKEFYPCAQELSAWLKEKNK